MELWFYFRGVFFRAAEYRIRPCRILSTKEMPQQENCRRFHNLELVFRALKYRLGRLRRVNIPGWSRRRPVDWARDEGHDRWLKYFQIPLKVFLTVLA
jgi:hypothetical protein